MDKVDRNEDSQAERLGHFDQVRGKSRNSQTLSQSDTLAGEKIHWKDVQIFMIAPGEQIDARGGHHLTIVPYQGQLIKGGIPPIILFHSGHLFYAEKDGQTFQDACASMQREDPNHIVVQTYQSQDFSVHGPTCCHALSEEEFRPVMEMPLFTAAKEEAQQQHETKNLAHTHEHEKTSSSRIAPLHAPHKRRHTVKKEAEEEDDKKKGVLPVEWLAVPLPGSIATRVESTNEWIEKDEKASHEEKKVRIKEELRKEDLGHLDEVRPAQENSLRVAQEESKQLQNKVRFSSPG